MIKARTPKSIQKKEKSALTVDRQLYQVLLDNKCHKYQSAAHLIIVLRYTLDKILDQELDNLADDPSEENEQRTERFQKLGRAIQEFIGEKKCQ